MGPLADNRVPLLAVPPCRTAAPVSLGWQFLKRQVHLLWLVRAFPVVVLLLVSLLEAGVTSQVGAVASQFYQLFLDGDAAGLPRALAWSTSLYLASAAVFTCRDVLKDLFAWQWRSRLTHHLQHLYHQQAAYYKGLQGLDTPDQRMAADAAQLTTTMAEVAAGLAAVPFSVVWYTYLTHQVFGSWVPVLAANLFFLLGALLQRAAMGPVAQRVAMQEAAEGAYRTSHARLLAWGPEVALYRPAPAELQHLQLRLHGVISNQLQLLLRRCCLTMTTKLLEYSGLIVNYGCLALAVFGGWWAGAAEQGPGGVAARVSLASFYLLTLVYSYTQVLDLASKLSDLAGLTVRVSELLEALEAHADTDASSSNSTKDSLARQHVGPKGPGNSSGSRSAVHDEGSIRGTVQYEPPAVVGAAADGVGTSTTPVGPKPTSPPHRSSAVEYVHQQHGAVDGAGLSRPQDSASSSNRLSWDADAAGQPSVPLLTVVRHGEHMSHERYATQAVLLQPPLGVLTKCSNFLEYSIHSLGSDLLQQEVKAVFPDAPRGSALLACVTFQFSGAARVALRQHVLQQLEHDQGEATGSVLGPKDSSTSSSDTAQLAPQASCSSSSYRMPAAGAPSSSHASSPPTSPLHHGPLRGTGTGTGQQQQQLQEQQQQEPEVRLLRPSLDGGASAAGMKEMQELLQVFLGWHADVQQHLLARGYWCDSIDPRTGYALSSTPGRRYDEVIGAEVLLGYVKQQLQGNFYMISHPEAGTDVYPATLFTNAPLPLLKEAAGAAGKPLMLPGEATPQSPAAAGVTRGTTGVTGSPLKLPAGWSKRRARSPMTAQAAAAAAAVAEAGNGGLGSSSSSSSPGAGLGVEAAPTGLSVTSSRALAAEAGQAASPPWAGSQHAPYAPSITGHQGAPYRTGQLSAWVEGAGVPASSPAAGYFALQLCQLSLQAPSGTWVVRDLSLQLPLGTHLLVTGPSGCGKTTLVRCMAGLVSPVAGAVTLLDGCDTWCTSTVATGAWGVTSRCAVAGQGTYRRAAVMFLPQRPLAAPGATLRHQLLYPAAAAPPAAAVQDTTHIGVAARRSGSAGACYPRSRNRNDRSGLLPCHTPFVCVGKQDQCRTPAAATGADQCRLYHEAGSSSSRRGGSRYRHQMPRQQAGDTSATLATCTHPGGLEEGLSLPDAVLLRALQQVGLGYLLPQLGAGLDTPSGDWQQQLSPGELQRLAVARVLLQQPQLAVLDEATSSLDEAAELQLYQALVAAGVTLVSVGHRRSLQRLHHARLHLAGEGSGGYSLHC